MRRRALVLGAVGGGLAAFAGRLHPAAAAATSLYRGPIENALVAVTIDCGSDRGYAGSILDTLAASGITCSFGMTGAWANANPALVQRMVDEGHHLINHTNTHRSFTGASTPGTGGLTADQRRWEIESTNQIVLDLTGVDMKPWFRPPYGDIDTAMLTQLGELGFQYNAMWSLDLRGWDGLTQNQIVNRVVNNHGNGYIYLMHAGGASQEGPALPRIISTLQGYGYGLTTLPGLVAGEGAPPPPPPAFVVGDTVKVTARLYLRSSTGTSARVITTMPTGTTCTVTGGPVAANGYAWYQLSTPYGSGWAAGEFLQKTTATPPPPPPGGFAIGDTVRVTARLNLRTGGGTAYGTIATMAIGTVCTVIGGPVSANGYTWNQLTTPYGNGWAIVPYLEKTTVSPPPPPPVGGFVAGDTVKVTAGLRLRNGPGTGNAIIATMPAGTMCTIVAGPTAANNFTWYQVDTPYGRGWTAGEYVEKAIPAPPPSGAFTPGQTVSVTAGLYLRTGPGFSTGVLVTMPVGTECTVVSGPIAANNLTWWEVDTSYGRGWAAGEFLKAV